MKQGISLGAAILWCAFALSAVGFSGFHIGYKRGERDGLRGRPECPYTIKHSPSLVRDFNGDGNNDVVYRKHAVSDTVKEYMFVDGSHIVVKQGDYFSDIEGQSLGYCLTGEEDSIEAQDVDGDGDLDIVVTDTRFPATFIPPYRTILYGDGKGNFSKPP